MIGTMSKYKVVLFDVDGVLLRSDVTKFFSHAYAEEHGFDKKDFDDFFARHADDVWRGKTTYKDLIVERNDVWRWDKDPHELLEKWFSHENYPDFRLIKLAKQLRKSGIHIYLATNQDKDRAKYLTKLFSDILDGAFISSDFGYIKEEPEFFRIVIDRLRKKSKALEPKQIVFFDDNPENITVAKSQDITAYLYESPEQVRKLLD